MPEPEESEGCPWQVGGNYPDTPPEYCGDDPDPSSEDGYCPKHGAAAAAMGEWERQNPPNMQTV